MLRKHFFYFFLILLVKTVAQQPAYFLLGENQFKGIQIFDLIQNNEGNFLIATNEGLFYFDYYSYQKIQLEDSKSNSVFNFVINENGIVFCHNLNNQIFKIQNKQCKLLYELRPDEISADVSLSINNNSLLIGARKLIRISETGIVSEKISINKSYFGHPFQYDLKTTYYHKPGTDSLICISDKGISEERLNVLGQQIIKAQVLQFFKLGNKDYAINQQSKAIYDFNISGKELRELAKNEAFDRSVSLRLYNTNSELWICGSLPGVIKLNDISQRQLKTFYEDYYISDVYRDREGNILLSTFDQGIIVIPDLEIPDVVLSTSEDPITSMNYDNQLGLLLGSLKGNLFGYKNSQVEILDNTGERNIEKIYTTEKFPFVIYDNKYPLVCDKGTKKSILLAQASLKDVAFVTDSLFFLGTNRGIIKCFWKGGRKFITSMLAGSQVRVYSLAYNERNKMLYVSNANGLFTFNINGTVNEILLNKKSVFTNALHYDNGLIYASNKKGGLIVVEDNCIVKSMPLKVNKESEVVTKFRIHNGKLYCKTFNGLFQFDQYGNYINTIYTTQSGAGNRLIDFLFVKDSLWISHTRGIQQIDYKNNQKEIVKPILHITGLFVNDSLINLSKSNFNSDQRKFQFNLSVLTLRNRESIRYHFKLLGNDDDWSINKYSENQVTYNALAAGSYTFYAKVEKNGVFSEVIIYPFTIDSPFYSKWWFISLLLLAFLTLVYLTYKWRLSIQEKKLNQQNELSASKLTAIQSQMNPHFIFNSLNSIQDLILKGDVEKSYTYITTFSNMVRKTLSYSQNDFIDFEKEIQLLELYLSLEKLRFKKDFEYTIIVDNISDIEIPPMIIQPFIENAIVHGLLHKAGEKKLTINFELKEILVCSIEDNGVGREKAKAIKERQRSDHDSFSVKATRRRFDILSSLYPGQFGVVYEDLMDGDVAIGTKVKLSLPIRRKF